MTVRHRWNRYWFEQGGEISAAMVRIAVAVSILLTLARVCSHPLIANPERAPHAIYHPVGILMLLGDSPPGWLIAPAVVIAWTATLALLIGLRTRTAAAISLVSSLIVVCWPLGFQSDWSHDNNLPLLALFALQGSRGGGRVGFDGLWRWWRGWPGPRAPSTVASVRLVQLTCALMFVAAAAFKIGAGHGTLDWALSDNLRHQILSQFDLNHLPRTAAADWLIAEPWRYRTVALLSLGNQLAPLFACVFVRRPWLRLLFGGCFALEVIGIGVVMDLWDLHWLPLIAVFVDWDWLAGQRGATPHVAPTSRRRTAASALIAVFLAYDVAVSFAYPRIDRALNTYPFSAYPMFAIIRAKRPYDRHQSYEFVNQRLELVGADGPVDPRIHDSIARRLAFRRLHRLDDPAALRARLDQLLKATRRQGVHTVRLFATIYQVPAYPGPARLIPHDIGLIAELHSDGTFDTDLGRLTRHGDRWSIEADHDLRGDQLLVVVDGVPPARPVAAELSADGHRALIDLPRGDLVHVVARRGDRDRVLARRAARAWW